MATQDDTPDFSAILHVPASEVSRPKQLPQGVYAWMVKGQPRFDRSTKKGTPFAEFTCQALEAGPDVNTDALKEALTKPNGEVIPLGERFMRLTFYLTEDAKYRCLKFLKDLGIDDEGGARFIDEMLSESPGRQFWGRIKHTPSDDGEGMYANIATTAPIVEEPAPPVQRPQPVRAKR